MKKRYTEKQIIGFFKEAEAGTPVKELCHRHGFSEPSYYTWRNKFGGMDVSDGWRRRKKVPISDRQPLIRPARAKEVWSMDFVFDRVADGRSIKWLGIVDDATRECVALVPGRSMSCTQVTRVLDELAFIRGLPTVIRSDNGPEFIGKGMLNWAHYTMCNSCRSSPANQTRTLVSSPSKAVSGMNA